MPTNYLVTEQELNAVADAIKAKNGTSGKLRWPTEMVSAIQNITTGVDTSDATVTANDLLSGVIAYGSDGTSITGSIPIRQSTDAFFEGMRYGPRNFNTLGYGQIHFSSGYYGGAHFPILNCSDYTITPSTSSQSITIFGSTATYEYFPRAITIEAMPVTDWSASGSINIDENKVLEGTYFYNSSGILQSGSITKSNLGILNLRPNQIILSESHLLTPALGSGYYPFEHQIELINSTSSIITITPSVTSQTITLLGSSATYNYFPYAITIESAITDWTGGGSVNIDENKVLSNTYFYNSTGSLTSGNIISYTSYQILIRTLTSDYEWHPSWATQVSTGYGIQMPNSCKISAGYYPESFYVKPNYDSTPWEITASTTDKTYYLINTSDIYYHTQPNQPIGFNSEAFPTSIIVKSAITDWTGNGSVNITSDKVLSDTYFYNNSGSLTSGNIPIIWSLDYQQLSLISPSHFDSSGNILNNKLYSRGYYNGSHGYYLTTSTSSIITITPSTSSQTITLFGPSATYNYFPYAITIKSAITDWTGNGSVNIQPSKVLSNTYFYNSTGSLTSGNIVNRAISLSTLPPSSFYKSGYPRLTSLYFPAGYYSQSHYMSIATTTTSWVITPSTTSQTFQILGTNYSTQTNKPSGFSSNALPQSIVIESISATDWTGNGSVNIEPNKVLEGAYFYNNTGSLTSGNIPIILSLTNTWFSSISPSNFDNDGYIQINQRYSRGYYNGSHAYHLASSTSSIITITPSTSSQTITLFGPSATYNYFPYAITINSMTTLSTSIKTLYPYQILNTGVPANTSQYFSSSYYYTESHYTSINTTSTPWTITPSTTSKTIYLFGTSYSTQTNKPSGFSKQAFPQSIIVESYTSTPTQITISSTDWIMNRSLISGYLSNDTITKIDAGAFGYCTNLLFISLSNCTTIGYEAFKECRSLQSARFSKCTTIGQNAFLGCPNLQSISFPMCTNIEDLAFQNCANLTTASFPKCTTIGSYAFIRCYHLTTLTLKNSTVAILSNTNAFTSTPISTFTSYTNGVYGSIFVPSSLVAAYKSATNWAIYSNRITSIPS